MPGGRESPLARLSAAAPLAHPHLPELVTQGPVQRHSDTLEAPQLVFTSSSSTETRPYLEDAADKVPERDDWWGHCVGYPGRGRTARRSARWVRDHQIDTQLFATALPRAPPCRT